MLGQNLILRLMKKLDLPWMSESHQCIGLYPSGDFIYITVFRREESGTIVAMQNKKISHAFMSHETDALSQYIEEHNLSQTPALLILPKEYYDVFILDDFLKNSPDKSSAVKWRLAEYLDYPCEESVVDYMALPCKSNCKGKIYALAMRENILKKCTYWAEKNNIYLQSIDVWQNVIKNAIAPGEQDKGTAIIQIGVKKSSLVMVRHNTLYFMRDISVYRENFITKNKEKLNETYELLSLEVQRSIDYCASHIKNPGITQAYINPDIIDVLEQKKLEAILGMSVGILTLEQLSAPPEEITMPQLISGSAALGGW